MTSRRLETRIRKLCGEALRAEQHELEAVFQELRVALQEHNELLRKLAAELSLRRPAPIPDPSSPERNGH
jgi:hypothetical protein